MNRTDFFNRIKKLDPYANHPSWAQGCFYGGETQILLNPEYIYMIDFTLLHMNHFIYYFKNLYMKKTI